MLQQEQNLNKELCKLGITAWFLQLCKLSFHTHVHHMLKKIQASSSTVVMCQLSNFIFWKAYIQQGIDQSWCCGKTEKKWLQEFLSFLKTSISMFCLLLNCFSVIWVYLTYVQIALYVNNLFVFISLIWEMQMGQPLSCAWSKPESWLELLAH
jgi:inner membrane protein involved in colicin E2 resistance